MPRTPNIHTATILDDEGTIDVPAGVIEALKLEPGDTLVFRIEDEDGSPVVIVAKGD